MKGKENIILRTQNSSGTGGSVTDVKGQRTYRSVSVHCFKTGYLTLIFISHDKGLTRDFSFPVPEGNEETGGRVTDRTSILVHSSM